MPPESQSPIDAFLAQSRAKAAQRLETQQPSWSEADTASVPSNSTAQEAKGPIDASVSDLRAKIEARKARQQAAPATTDADTVSIPPQAEATPLVETTADGDDWRDLGAMSQRWADKQAGTTTAQTPAAMDRPPRNLFQRLGNGNPAASAPATESDTIAIDVPETATNNSIVAPAENPKSFFNRMRQKPPVSEAETTAAPTEASSTAQQAGDTSRLINRLRRTNPKIIPAGSVTEADTVSTAPQLEVMSPAEQTTDGADWRDLGAMSQRWTDRPTNPDTVPAENPKSLFNRLRPQPADPDAEFVPLTPRRDTIAPEQALPEDSEERVLLVAPEVARLMDQGLDRQQAERMHEHTDAQTKKSGLSEAQKRLIATGLGALTSAVIEGYFKVDLRQLSPFISTLARPEFIGGFISVSLLSIGADKLVNEADRAGKTDILRSKMGRALVSFTNNLSNFTSFLAGMGMGTYVDDIGGMINNAAGAYIHDMTDKFNSVTGNEQLPTPAAIPPSPTAGDGLKALTPVPTAPESAIHPTTTAGTTLHPIASTEIPLTPQPTHTPEATATIHVQDTLTLGGTPDAPTPSPTHTPEPTATLHPIEPTVVASATPHPPEPTHTPDVVPTHPPVSPIHGPDTSYSGDHYSHPPQVEAANPDLAGGVTPVAHVETVTFGNQVMWDKMDALTHEKGLGLDNPNGTREVLVDIITSLNSEGGAHVDFSKLGHDAVFQVISDGVIPDHLDASSGAVGYTIDTDDLHRLAKLIDANLSSDHGYTNFFTARDGEYDFSRRELADLLSIVNDDDQYAKAMQLLGIEVTPTTPESQSAQPDTNTQPETPATQPSTGAGSESGSNTPAPTTLPETGADHPQNTGTGIPNAAPEQPQVQHDGVLTQVEGALAITPETDVVVVAPGDTALDIALRMPGSDLQEKFVKLLLLNQDSILNQNVLGLDSEKLGTLQQIADAVNVKDRAYGINNGHLSEVIVADNKNAYQTLLDSKALDIIPTNLALNVSEEGTTLK